MRSTAHFDMRRLALRALFEDVREDGVRVTLVHPGFVNTPPVKTAGLERSRMIQVEDISEMIAAALMLPNTACVTELTVRPQRSPYLQAHSSACPTRFRVIGNLCL